MIGFAAPAMVCLALGAALKLSVYAHTSGPFVTWEGINALRNGSGGVAGLLCIQAVLGAIGLAFARGAIARLALSDAKDAPGLGCACREAKSRLPSLLIGSLVYGVLLAAGAIGVNAGLRGTDLDLSNVGRPAMTMPDQGKVLALRTLDVLVPNSGPPFAEFVPVLRHAAFEQAAPVTFYEQRLAEEHGEDKVFSRARTVNLWLIALAGAFLLILAEALLRFTPVMAMSSCEQRRQSAIMPLLCSVGFGIRHFGAITKHVWLLRLAFVAGYGIFFALPVVLSQDVLPTIMTNEWKSVTASWSVTLTLICYWLVVALFTAFSAVYDARLSFALIRIHI
jgi:hypothetical protein